MTEFTYAADPGKSLDSDVHRRVLGHLSTPEDNFGWKPSALYARLLADVHPAFGQDQLEQVLGELKEKGHATDNDVGVWQQTPKGFESLTAEVPGADEGPVRPANIGAATPLGEPLKDTPAATPVEGATSV